MIEKAAATGVALEINADPHRLDLDWRRVRQARDRGVAISIGADAHNVAGLPTWSTASPWRGKAGWAADVLNTLPAGVFSRAGRRAGGRDEGQGAEARGRTTVSETPVTRGKTTVARNSKSSGRKRSAVRPSGRRPALRPKQLTRTPSARSTIGTPLSSSARRSSPRNAPTRE